jgi:hydrogenase nickel incorporation protein HypA/HybF
MHEHHIVEGIVKQVLEKAALAQAKRVTEVFLVMGTESGLAEESVRMYFAEISKGTMAEQALVHIASKPVTLRCNSCDVVFDYKRGDFNCPTCGNLGVRATTAKEFYIDRIEVES